LLVKLFCKFLLARAAMLKIDMQCADVRHSIDACIEEDAGMRKKRERVTELSPAQLELAQALEFAGPALIDWLGVVKDHWQASAVHLWLGEHEFSTWNAPQLANANWEELLGSAAMQFVPDLNCIAVRVTDAAFFVAPSPAILILDRPAVDKRGLASLALIKRYVDLLASFLGLACRHASLIQDRKRISFCLQSAQAGAWSYEPKSQKVRFDSIVAAYLALPPGTQEVSFDRFLDALHVDDRLKFETQIARAWQQRVRIEFRSDADNWYASTLIGPAQTGHAGVIHGLMRDFDAQKASQHESQLHERQLESLVKQLRESSRTDPLTHLANRLAFNERLSLLTRATTRGASYSSLMILDADHFKSFNDQYGHVAGDQALKQLALVLRECCKDGELPVRLGGEEFCVLSTRAPAEALQHANEIQRALASQVWLHRPLTVSVGLCSSNAAEIDADTFYKTADAALYQAKKDGRNCTRVKLL
jgi:diguanylate cyclase (GGDEF)-like protein